MQIILSDFMSLDGVVQAPGGRDEDTDGGFAYGGWSHPYFDADTMGPALDEVMTATDALLFGRRTWQGMAAAWPKKKAVRSTPLTSWLWQLECPAAPFASTSRRARCSRRTFRRSRRTTTSA